MRAMSLAVILALCTNLSFVHELTAVQNQVNLGYKAALTRKISGGLESLRNLSSKKFGSLPSFLSRDSSSRSYSLSDTSKSDASKKPSRIQSITSDVTEKAKRLANLGSESFKSLKSGFSNAVAGVRRRPSRQRSIDVNVELEESFWELPIGTPVELPSSKCTIASPCLLKPDDSTLKDIVATPRCSCTHSPPSPPRRSPTGSRAGSPTGSPSRSPKRDRSASPRPRLRSPQRILNGSGRISPVRPSRTKSKTNTPAQDSQNLPAHSFKPSTSLHKPQISPDIIPISKSPPRSSPKSLHESQPKSRQKPLPKSLSESLQEFQPKSPPKSSPIKSAAKSLPKSLSKSPSKSLPKSPSKSPPRPPPPPAPPRWQGPHFQYWQAHVTSKDAPIAPQLRPQPQPPKPPGSPTPPKPPVSPTPPPPANPPPQRRMFKLNLADWKRPNVQEGIQPALAPNVDPNDPHQVAFYRLQTKLLKYFTHTEAPPKNDFLALLEEVHNEQFKPRSQDAEQRSKKWIEEHCGPLMEEDRVELIESPTLKQECIIRCHKLWGFAFVPPDVTPPPIDPAEFFACGRLVRLVEGEVKENPAPYLNEDHMPVFACNCKTAFEFYNLMDYYEVNSVSFNKLRNQPDLSVQYILEWLKIAFYGTRVQILSHAEFMLQWQQLFDRRRWPNPYSVNQDFHTFWLQKGKAAGGEDDELADDAYWEGMQF